MTPPSEKRAGAPLIDTKAHASPEADWRDCSNIVTCPDCGGLKGNPRALRDRHGITGDRCSNPIHGPSPEADEQVGEEERWTIHVCPVHGVREHEVSGFCNRNATSYSAGCSEMLRTIEVIPASSSIPTEKEVEGPWEARDNDGMPPCSVQRGTAKGGDLQTAATTLTYEQAERIEAALNLDFQVREVVEWMRGRANQTRLAAKRYTSPIASDLATARANAYKSSAARLSALVEGTDDP